MTLPKVRPGRPREFDTAKAVSDVTNVFWRNGYAATTLDTLVDQVGLSRSSFYAFFGSKRRALHVALQSYANEAIADLNVARDASPDPRTAVHAMMRTAVNPAGGRHGCFMANCTMEVAPVDAEVDAIVQQHFTNFRALFEACFSEIGLKNARGAARSVLALTLGLLALRKAGNDPDELDRMIDQGIADIIACDA